VSSAAGAPAWAADPDRDLDGVMDAKDLCPMSPPGAWPVAEGCSALEFALAPDRFVDAIRGPLDGHAAAMPDGSIFAEAGFAFQEASAGIGEAAARLRAGQVCEAADLYDAALARLGDAEAALERDGAERASRLLTRLSAGNADKVGGFFQAACKEVVGATSLRARVDSVDAASRTFRLRNGRTAGLAEGDFATGPMRGRPLQARGLAFADGTVLVTEVLGAAPRPAPAGLKATPCLKLWVAPMQDFPPYNPNKTSFLLNETEGYLQPGNFISALNLERHQRLAVKSTGCSTSGGQLGQTISYSAKIQIAQGGTTWTMASSLEPGETPVAFPSSLALSALATITSTTYKTVCTLGFGCGTPQVQATETWPAVVRPFGHYAMAIYDKTLFDVGGNDGVINDFEIAKITGLTLANVPDTTPNFIAVSHKVTNNSPSLGGTGIGIGTPFAVYEYDKFYDETAVANPFETINQFFLHGVDHPAAVEWPRIAGTNSHTGKQFLYSVQVPYLVRDRVFNCSGSLDSFYLLPYDDLYPAWTLTKGNFDDPTSGHTGIHQFALSFTTFSGADVYPARGGVVMGVVESFSTNGNPLDPESNGNWIVIRHEDGTHGFYFNLAQNGALVEVGDRVFRDEHIANAASKLFFEVGNQCPPHQCSALTGYQTVKALYQVGRAEFNWLTGWQTVEIQECKVPRVGDQLSGTYR
jgi:murein DD-endopeptidase MepM/ murein hydrolase activator NlpD